MDALMDEVTRRLNMSRSAKKMFTTQGMIVRRLNQLCDGMEVVVTTGEPLEYPQSVWISADLDHLDLDAQNDRVLQGYIPHLPSLHDAVLNLQAGPVAPRLDGVVTKKNMKHKRKEERRSSFENGVSLLFV